MIVRGQAVSERAVIAPACYIGYSVGAAHYRAEL